MDTFVLENYALLKKHRLFAALVPCELGGENLPHAQMCDMLRILAQYCGSTALALSMHQHLLAAGELLGLLQQSPAAWFKAMRPGQSAGAQADETMAADATTDADIDALVAERDAARKARDFARSDAIRQQLADLGVTVEDRADGARWRWQR